MKPGLRQNSTQRATPISGLHHRKGACGGRWSISSINCQALNIPRWSQGGWMPQPSLHQQQQLFPPKSLTPCRSPPFSPLSTIQPLIRWDCHHLVLKSRGRTPTFSEIFPTLVDSACRTSDCSWVGTGNWKTPFKTCHFSFFTSCVSDGVNELHSLLLEF